MNKPHAIDGKPAAKKTIFVVDDHAVFREGLVRLLNQEPDLKVCGESADAAGAIKQVAHLKPDLVIVDISLEGTNGIDLTKTLRDSYPDLFLLVLSMHKENLHAERALRAGANGYIMKRQSGRELLQAIRQVLGGQVYVSDAVKDTILQRMTHTGKEVESTLIASLSDREVEVFQFIGEGYGTRQIADMLHLSMKTVQTHREHIREKLNLNSGFELIQRAIHWVHEEDVEKQK